MSGRLNEAYNTDPGEVQSDALGLRWRAHDTSNAGKNFGNEYQDDVGLNMEKLEENNIVDHMDDKLNDMVENKKTVEPSYSTTPLPVFEGNWASKLLLCVRSKLHKIVNNHKTLLKRILRISMVVVICIYLGFVIKNWVHQGKPTPNWCNGVGFLLLLVGIVSWCTLYYKIIKPILIKEIMKHVTEEIKEKTRRISRTVISTILWFLVAAIIIFVIYDSLTYWRRLISFSGIFLLILLGFTCSKYPSYVPWRTVVVGTVIQYSVGLLAVRWQIGREIFTCAGNLAERFLTFSYVGAEMVYGSDLVTNKAIFAFQALSAIFFTSMFVQVLFYLGWMQLFCHKLGWFIQVFMGTTVCESVNAVSSVFLGMSEAPFLYIPYIKDLTTSEIHAVMVGGLSTVAGTVFAAYAALGANTTHIITASVMTAPAALMYAKILLPETEVSKTDAENFHHHKSEDTSVIDAATQGAIAGVGIVQSIIASVIAAVSLVAFANSVVEWFFNQAGIPDTNIETLMSYLLIPVAWLMGVQPDNCKEVARLIGIKTIVNEFVGYAELGKVKKAGLLSPRSEAIATFAMCSFANPGSVAILTAILLKLCPTQRVNIIKVSVRAFFGGVITSLITACVAGSLMPEEGFGDMLPTSNSTLIDSIN